MGVTAGTCISLGHKVETLANTLLIPIQTENGKKKKRG